MSSTIYFNLDKFKILSSGNGLKLIVTYYTCVCAPKQGFQDLRISTINVISFKSFPYLMMLNIVKSLFEINKYTIEPSSFSSKCIFVLEPSN